MAELRDGLGFELPFFMDIFDILRSLWRSDVILRPISHRFLRGTVQLIVRVISFLKDGLVGKIVFDFDKASFSEEDDHDTNDGGKKAI